MLNFQKPNLISKIRNYNLVFKRLIISHIVIVATLSIAIGSVATAYFSRTLENQMIDQDRETLIRISENVNDRIFELAERVWVTSVQSDSEFGRFFSEPSGCNHSYFYSIYEQINRIKSENYGIINEIEIYSKELGILISGRHGIKYIRGEHTDTSFSQFDRMIQDGYIRNEWIVLGSSETAGAWSPGNEIALFRTYPYIKNVGMPFKGYCAIILNENAVYDIISVDKESQKDTTLIINQQGTVCSSNDRTLIGKTLAGEEYIKRVLESEGNSFFRCEADGDTRIVSSALIGDTGMRVIKLVPSRIFFKELTTMRLMIAIICVVFIIIGTLVSFFWVKNTYRPLKMIISNIRSMGRQEDNDPVNEYSLINSTLDTLSTKVSELERTLEANSQVIKNSLIIDILNGDADEPENIAQRLRLANITLNKPNYLAIAAAVSKNPKIGLRELEYCKFDVMQEMDSLSDAECVYCAASMSQNKIGVIVNSQEINVDRILTDLYNISERTLKKHGISIYYGVGSWTSAPVTIAVSYQNADTCLGYHYINPEQDLFLFDEFAGREISEAALPKNILTGFDEALKYGEYDDAVQQIDLVTQEIRASFCTYIQCEFCLNNMINILMKHIEEQNIDSREVYPQSLYVGLKEHDNIYSASRWIKSVVEKYFVLKKNKTVISNTQIIELAKKYIDEHISEDLSLSTMAEKLFFSAPYLSKLFKRETGVNFNAYVTEKRLEYARELLMNSSSSVNTISEKAGFGSSNYFIKKFKERYGDTPINYKNNYINSDLNGKEE